MVQMNLNRDTMRFHFSAFKWFHSHFQANIMDEWFIWHCEMGVILKSNHRFISLNVISFDFMGVH